MINASKASFQGELMDFTSSKKFDRSVVHTLLRGIEAQSICTTKCIPNYGGRNSYILTGNCLQQNYGHFKFFWQCKIYYLSLKRIFNAEVFLHTWVRFSDSGKNIRICAKVSYIFHINGFLLQVHSFHFQKIF